MYIAELSALAAALCWSFGGLISTTPARQLGAVRFNRIRLILVFLMLTSYTMLTGGWATLDLHSCLVLMLSSLIGIFLGDTFLFATLKRLGPRRNGILFTINAPFSVIIGYIFLEEVLPLKTVTGCILIMIGVILAIFFGNRTTRIHSFEKIEGPLTVGICFGLLSALCQSISVIIARPIMASGVDAVAGSTLRVGTSALALILLQQFVQPKSAQNSPHLTFRLLFRIGLSGLVGMAMGMTFLLFALIKGEAGLVSTLSATSPIFILPILWIATKEKPAFGAWVGASLAVLGMAFIFQ